MGRDAIRIAAITGAMAKIMHTLARVMPCANKTPASAGPAALAIRIVPMTKPIPDARKPAGKVVANMVYIMPVVPAMQKPRTPAVRTNK